MTRSRSSERGSQGSEQAPAALSHADLFDSPTISHAELFTLPTRSTYGGLWAKRNTERRAEKAARQRVLAELLAISRRRGPAPPRDLDAPGFCRPCRSHFCPHVAPYLYAPPFADGDELAGATEAWELAGRQAKRAAR